MAQPAKKSVTGKVLRAFLLATTLGALPACSSIHTTLPSGAVLEGYSTPFSTKTRITHYDREVVNANQLRALGNDANPAIQEIAKMATVEAMPSNTIVADREQIEAARANAKKMLSAIPTVSPTQP